MKKPENMPMEGVPNGQTPPTMSDDFAFVKADLPPVERRSLGEWLGKPPVYTEDQIREHMEADVIVCGGGIAGIAAVRAAVEAGASVILFEKASRPQARSGQFAVIGGKLLERWGMAAYGDPNEIVNTMMHDNSYRADQRILKYFAGHIGEDFDWYMEGAPEDLYYQDAATDPVPEGVDRYVSLMQHPHNPAYDLHTERFPCYPLTVQIRPGHNFVLMGNLALAEATGRVRTCFHTPVKSLLREPNGRVYGVIAEKSDGTAVQATAKKGVVLATGDYACDRDMLAYYCPWALNNRAIPSGMDAHKRPVNTGDGHRMGLWVGAKMEEEPHGVMSHNMGGVMGVAPFLLLNTDGERFMNEDCTGQQIENQLSRIKGRTAWQIFDSAWPEQIPAMPFGHSSPSQVIDEDGFQSGKVNPDLVTMDGYASKWCLEGVVARGKVSRPDEAIGTYLALGIRSKEAIGALEMYNARGRTVKADTLEELFELIGLPAKTAAASVARYNVLAEEGCDEDFGKTARRLFPLIKPPYYATQFSPTFLLAVVSGLESDRDAHVLDGERNIIPGLYAAGNVQGNRFGPEYPVTLPGLSHSMALTYGRAAGRNAAQGK